MPTESVQTEIEKLRSQIRQIKFVGSFTAAGVAIFAVALFQIQASNVRTHVEDALTDEGVRAAMQTLNQAQAYIKATRNALGIVRVVEIPVISTEHSSNKVGQYLNFDLDVMNRGTGRADWTGDKVILINSRTGDIAPGVLWEDTNGGPEGTGHGRFRDSDERQWRGGDTAYAIVVGAPTPEEN